MKYYIEGKDLPTGKLNRVQTIEEADVFIVKGGDGTLLRAIKKITCTETIIMGINTGHVGFLSNDLKPEEVGGFLNLTKDQLSHYISKRDVLINNYIEDKALNEIVIQPVNRGKLFELNVEINGEHLHYKGDGLIISTASGSTAYNLSAGGPIVFPNLRVISLTPLNPFTLASRPIVVGDNTIISISSEEKAEITVDGDMVRSTILNGMEVQLSNKTINLFKIDTFFNAIQHKLGWNRSIK